LAKRCRHADVDRIELGDGGEVGRRIELAGPVKREDVARPDVWDVGPAFADRLDLAVIEIDARRVEPGFCELDREGETDVTETDHAGAGRACLDLFEQKCAAR